MASAEVKKEAVEELRVATEQKLNQVTAVNHSLEKELRAIEIQATKLAADLKKRWRKLCSTKMLLKDSLRNAKEATIQRTELEKRITTLEYEVASAEHKAELVGKNALHAIEAYKRSEAFDEEMHDAGVESYHIGFLDYLEKVVETYPDLDVSPIDITGDSTNRKKGVGNPVEEILAPPTDEGVTKEASTSALISRSAEKKQS